jgi:two-component system, OmpR family, catabolic regulation response regulator CreB
VANSLIFIVEDEPSIAQTVQFALESEGFATEHFSTGQACMAALEDRAPALILLDVGLPDVNGFDFFRMIRQRSSAAVIFLTARNDEIDRVVGLEMGADDYIVKPFSLREMIARVRVALRHHDTAALGRRDAIPADTQALPVQSFYIDNERRRIHFRTVALDLTLHEYRLLETLLDHPGRVFSRGQLLERAWDNPDHRLERTVDSHIKSLRGKLRAVDSNANPICTHRGIGYSLDPDS